MKTFSLPMMALAAAMQAAVAQAVSSPQSPVITYGHIRDEYGSPLTSFSAAEILLVTDANPDGRIYARTVAGETPFPGMNYRLSLEIDSAGPVREYAVTAGTRMRIKCMMDGVDQFASRTGRCVFATPAQGTAQRLDLSLGEDADDDGMPDDWERWYLSCHGRPSDGAALLAFAADGDDDGDGMTNMREYLAGTDPFLSTDLMKITSFDHGDGTGRAEIRFTTAVDRTYRLVAADSLEDPVWVPVAAARSRTGTPEYAAYAGTGRTMTLYFDLPEGSQAFFKIAVQ